MMRLRLVLLLFIVEKCSSLSSPIQPRSNYKYSTELDANIADLWWTIDDAEREITFELHVKTTGWVGLGISPGRFTFRLSVWIFEIILIQAVG